MKNDLISMKIIFFIMQIVFVNFFSKNLETIFLEEDIIFAKIIKKDKKDKNI